MKQLHRHATETLTRAGAAEVCDITHHPEATTDAPGLRDHLAETFGGECELRGGYVICDVDEHYVVYRDAHENVDGVSVYWTAGLDTAALEIYQQLRTDGTSLERARRLAAELGGQQ